MKDYQEKDWSPSKHHTYTTSHESRTVPGKMSRDVKRKLHRKKGGHERRHLRPTDLKEVKDPSRGVKSL